MMTGMLKKPRPTLNDFQTLYALVWVLLSGIILVLIFARQLPEDFILSESGPIEMISAISYFLCGMAVLYLAGQWTGKWPTTFLFAMLGFRELDFHSRFTTMNITKIKFYLSPQVPLNEKLIGFTAIALCVYAAYRLQRIEGKRWWSDLTQCHACSYGVLFGLTCIVLAKSLDGLARKFRDFGWKLDDKTAHLAGYIEETLELGISMMFALAIWCYYRNRVASS
jgi:hypothetical protein